MPTHARLMRQYALFSYFVALVTAFAGALVLLGWSLDIGALKSVIAGFVTMKPMTALCFVLSGVALALLRLGEVTPRRRTIANVLASLIAVIGALTIAEYLIGWNLGIDGLVLYQVLGSGDGGLSVRMAPPTALAFVFLGSSLLTLDRAVSRTFLVSSIFALLALIIGFVALLGYLYGEPMLYRLHPTSWVALHAAILLVSFGAALIAARPDQGLISPITSDRIGGWLARRALPLAVTLPLVIGWIRLRGQREGLYGTEFGLALFAATNVVVFATLVWFGARSLNSVDRKREAAESETHRSAELFSTAFYSNPAAMALTRLRDLVYVDVNDAFLRMCGFERDEVVGRLSSQFGIVAPSRREGLIRDLSNGIGFRDLDLEISAKGGQKRHALVSGELVTVQGEPHALSVMLDITERKRAQEEHAHIEEQLRQSQKLQALGTLAAGIAHDFNNVLAIIVGNTRFAREEIPVEHSAQRALSEVSTASARATDLVRRILTFGRRNESERRAVELRSVVQGGLDLLRPLLPSNIDIRTKFESGLAIVSADSAQVHQVVLNLGTNAAHAMGAKGGVLDFGLRSATVTTELAATSPELREGQYEVLSVSDNGCGINPDALKRIFEPFFTTKAPGEGTGLGLAVVHGIMQNHGGAVTAYSEADRGTVFRLYFPSTGVLEADALPVAKQGEEAGHGEHILYVDDERALIFLAERQLQKWGYRVTSATDPVQALQLFRTRPLDFDAVVTDLSMPGMSGLEFVRRIREVRPDIPVVITSGYIREEDIVAAGNIGVTDLVLKPNTVEELGGALHRLLTIRITETTVTL